jgi:hypothetical protein
VNEDIDDFCLKCLTQKSAAVLKRPLDCLVEQWLKVFALSSSTIILTIPAGMPAQQLKLKRTEYQRAMGARLDGRGYTTK